MPPPPGVTPGRRWPRTVRRCQPRRPARAGNTSARVVWCCGTVPSSRRSGSRTAAARRASPVMEFSPWDLHTALLRLIDELGGILPQAVRECANVLGRLPALTRKALELRQPVARERTDRKSTRLNSSHVEISYAVFCLKKKKKTEKTFCFTQLQRLKQLSRT